MSQATEIGLSQPTLLAQVKPFIRTMRPKQYTKNIFVWAALVFDQKLFFGRTPFNRYVFRTLVAFVLFCLISSVVYLINDLVDIDKDRQHPNKRDRALPSGELMPKVAGIGAAILVLITIPPALWLGSGEVMLLYGYLLLMVAYTFWLKNLVIVDVMTIAAGFVLRVACGALAVSADRFSPWIYMCMTLLALFLGIAKRRQEIVLMKDSLASTRVILQEYTLRYVDEMLALVSASTVMAYALYTFSAPNLPPSHTMMLTVPCVIYGLFRYLYLIHVKGETEPPDVVVLKDRPLQIDVVLFAIVVVLAFYVLPAT